MKRLSLSIGLLIGILLAASGRAQESTIDLILVLATDISGSIQDWEYDVQKLGIVAALRDPEVARALATCASKGAALGFAEWSGFGSFAAVVPMRRIHTKSDLNQFADLIEGSNKSVFTSPATDIAYALEQSAQLIRESGLTAERRVIDLSSDGTQNDADHDPEDRSVDYVTRVRGTRDVVVANQIEINVLAIERHNIPEGYRDLFTYFDQNVRGGAKSFVISIDRIAEMRDGLKRKLLREICANANF